MILSVRRIINSVDHRLVRPLTGRDAKNWSAKTDFQRTYPRLVRELMNWHSRDEAMKLAVGGEFERIGVIERETLIYHGLQKTDYLIDVGCGSGRLAKPLAEYLVGDYLGIDIVPELVAYARDLVPRPEWRFQIASGLTIAEEDEKADMVCFFSVFTHLLHEESFAYLREAKRVLRSGGKIVLSFLDFKVPSHWAVFETSLQDIGVGSHPLNVFISEDMLRVWAEHLELDVEVVKHGDESYLPITSPSMLEGGAILKDRVTLGQSVCVLVSK